MSSFPIRVEPVNVIFLTALLAINTSVTTLDCAITRLNTPFGKPTSWKIFAISTADCGALLDGFNTIVHPAARAGATLRAIIDNGKFQGVMAPTTPMGCLITRILVSFELAGTVSP